MAWSTVTSSGSGGRNDDLARIVAHGDTIDVLLLDGATSLAECDHVDAVDGDPAWFVRTFADAFEAVVRRAGGDHDHDHDNEQEAQVQSALAEVRAAWHAGDGTGDVPRWAWPIAALSWIRIRRATGGATLELYCLGDCKVLLAFADGTVRDPDPYDNAHEHHLQRSVAALAASGMDDPARRFAAMLPQLRARREAQQAAASPEVLCLAPAAAFAARRHALDVPAGTLLLTMTDGFYRLTDPYGLFDDAALARACACVGLDAMLATLRRFEAEGDTARSSVKRADDATAVMLRLA